jgi:hypothetical protein
MLPRILLLLSTHWCPVLSKMASPVALRVTFRLKGSPAAGSATSYSRLLAVRPAAAPGLRSNQAAVQQEHIRLKPLEHEATALRLG